MDASCRSRETRVVRMSIASSWRISPWRRAAFMPRAIWLQLVPMAWIATRSFWSTFGGGRRVRLGLSMSPNASRNSSEVDLRLALAEATSFSFSAAVQRIVITLVRWFTHALSVGFEGEVCLPSQGSVSYTGFLAVFFSLIHLPPLLCVVGGSDACDFAVLAGCRYGQMMVSAIRLGSLLTKLSGKTILAELADNAGADSTWPPSVGAILTDWVAMVSRAEMHVSSPDQIKFEERRDTDTMNPDCWIRRSERLSAGEVSPFSKKQKLNLKFNGYSDFHVGSKSLQ